VKVWWRSGHFLQEAICAKVYGQTDRRTDDGCLAIVLAHSWNELKTDEYLDELKTDEYFKACRIIC